MCYLEVLIKGSVLKKAERNPTHFLIGRKKNTDLGGNFGILAVLSFNHHHPKIGLVYQIHLE